MWARFTLVMLYRSRLPRLLILLTISDKNINKTDCPFRKGNVYIDFSQFESY